MAKRKAPKEPSCFVRPLACCRTVRLRFRFASSPLGGLCLPSPLGAKSIISQNGVSCQERGQRLRSCEAEFSRAVRLSSFVI
jgi:hypothetical protein